MSAVPSSTAPPVKLSVEPSAPPLGVEPMAIGFTLFTVIVAVSDPLWFPESVTVNVAVKVPLSA